MNNLLVLDHANIMHKAIFSYISQIKKEMLDIAYENDWVTEPDEKGQVHILEEHWQECYDLVMEKIRKREVVIMFPIYTYFKMIISYFKRIGVTLDDKVIIGIDFSSWRKKIDPLYKKQRKAFRESFMPKWWWDKTYKEFNDFIPKLEISLNWNFVKVYDCEFDDIASVAIRQLNDYNNKIIISADEDLQQLCIVPNTKIFSPYSKKYKIVNNPEKILLKKIKGDKSDNLLENPQTIQEYNIRKKIVDLLHLPEEIEKPIKDILLDLPIKQLYLERIPFPSCRKAIKDLYNL
jgi:hypothetical protein